MSKRSRQRKRTRQKSHFKFRGSGNFKKQIGKRDIFPKKYSEEVKIQDEDFLILCTRYRYHHRFTSKLLHSANHLKNKYEEKLQDKDFLKSDICRDRVDLSKEIVFTIDGEDAKDFDDAVSLRKEGDRYHLGVHIADVSYFIKENSPLDEEALRRSNSVYLVNRVIPMFPEPISNYLCSLVEGQYRLTYSCFVEIDLDGRIKSYDFKRSVIKSIRRCTYQEVEEVLNKKKSLSLKIDSALILMNELKTILRQRRVEEGSINFTSYEQSFVIGREKVKSVKMNSSLISENLIEEFMLIANICAARTLTDYGLGIYRVHNLPKTEKLISFERFVNQLGYRMPKSGTLNPLQEKGKNRYVIFLDRIDDPDIRRNLSFLLLISMSQAEYNIDNIGHYGLAFKKYTHFTSPIRRYPDLAVHRLLSYIYKNKTTKLELFPSKKKKPIKEFKNHLKKISQLASENERKAVDAEREYSKVKSMRYLQDCFDQVMEAMVMKVKENGMFVQILDTGIEGFINMYDLEPDLFFDPDREAYKRKKKVIYELGTHLHVKLSNLNFNKLFIDFKPI